MVKMNNIEYRSKYLPTLNVTGSIVLHYNVTLKGIEHHSNAFLIHVSNLSGFSINNI